MHKSRPLTLAERKVLEDKKDSKLSSSDLSELIGRGKNTVNVEYRRAGDRKNYNAKIAHQEAEKREAGRTEKRTHVSEETKQKVKEMFDQGFSQGQVRKELGVSYFTMANVMKDLGMKHKPFFQLLDELSQRIGTLEEQINILTDMIQEGKND